MFQIVTIVALVFGAFLPRIIQMYASFTRRVQDDAEKVREPLGAKYVIAWFAGVFIAACCTLVVYLDLAPEVGLVIELIVVCIPLFSAFHSWDELTELQDELKTELRPATQ